MKEIISRKNNSNSNKGQREKLFATIENWQFRGGFRKSADRKMMFPELQNLKT